MFSVIDVVLVCVFAVVYLWAFYNLPILAVGVRSKRRSYRVSSVGDSVGDVVLPSFSVLVPVKNEGKLVGRLFGALSNLDYPKDKVEVVLVEDGSSDNTLEVCRAFASTRGNVKVLTRSLSDGKPSALNFGLKSCGGDLVAFFDADSVPACDSFLRASRYFAEPGVAAVQGRTLSINPEENMLTKFISYEEGVWSEAYLRGKDVLGLFVHLRGSCQFIRRGVLVGLGGLDSETLSEDMELSARLTRQGYRIRYGGDVCAWQESPSSLRMLFRQRTRWFRGTMEVAFRYSGLMAKPSMRNFDAEATLFAPFIIIASLLSYIVGSGVFFVEFPFNVLWSALVFLSIVTTTVMMLLAGTSLVFVSKPMRIGNLRWLPFVLVYWWVQGFIALYAAFLIVLRRPKRWVKTEKSGAVSDSVFASGRAGGLNNCSVY